VYRLLYVDISRRSAARGHQTREWWENNSMRHDW